MRASTSLSNASTSRPGGILQRVQFEVEQRGRRVLHRLEALVEGAGGFELLQDALGHRLARLFVEREFLQHLGPRQPVLVEL